MESFFNSLDSVGFKFAGNIEPHKPIHGKSETKRTLEKSLPSEYLSVINKLLNPQKKKVLLKKANSINLFIKTKFGETNIYDQWSEIGVIPKYYYKGLNTSKISSLAKSIISLRDKIKKDKFRVREIEKLDKPKTQQMASWTSQLSLDSL
ncbi:MULTISPECIES: hypothetical protein [Idiomarina]|jgi:N-acetylmuramoyl-L-alanine amidase CwlA|uniref:hypothetical protein n=1 Tax=Idiomarina TaxID=135575 RepID=UPI000C483745|nr:MULTISPECIES: hypothetical protein [Idiomarina]MBF79665.1 hypothetical protein [Idiomarina sp.]|tara:strand:- start:91 stop:540 length:450 start_codon:yes stop_codon:yes gene_type:complete